MAIERRFMTKLDRINVSILKNLQFNARVSNLDLADKVGLSQSPCLQRVRNLEKGGFIRRYLSLLNIDKIGPNVQFIALISLRSHSSATYRKFESSIRAMPEIVSCYQVSGENDYVAHFVCRDPAAFKKLAQELLDSNLDIRSFTSQIVLEEVKAFAGYPIESLTLQP